jgi:selenobiotic family peptide radical SAM maturase
MEQVTPELEGFYPACKSLLKNEVWKRILGLILDKTETFPDFLAHGLEGIELPEFLADLARLEWNYRQTSSDKNEIPKYIGHLQLNPTIQLLQLGWKNLPSILSLTEGSSSVKPEKGKEFVLLWKDPHRGETKVQTASSEDLLVLKVLAEGISSEEVATQGKVPVGAVDEMIDRAVERGILLRPPSLIRRDPAAFSSGKIGEEKFLASPVFTLQWHITQACDLRCRHCYDRSQRSSLSLDQGLAVLDDLRAFCRSRNVKGQVSFSGGNPLLHPHFLDLFRAAGERGFSTAILGNPAPGERIQEILAVQKPVYFQLSLEGLREHNDSVRGEGHFERVMGFLKALREMGIYSMVMLTLTRDNLNQVLPLAQVLRERADLFTFNRLSQVGEGAKLRLPDPESYAKFLEEYVEAAKTNPVLGLKDNLLNIVYHQKRLGLFGGCTGYGCGAAFNFMAVLPDGEVHACRKFPSLMGSILEQGLGEIYDSELARRYRAGSLACRSCDIRPICGGCPAVIFGSGLDPFQDRDPFCLIHS